MNKTIDEQLLLQLLDFLKPFKIDENYDGVDQNHEIVISNARKTIHDWLELLFNYGNRYIKSDVYDRDFDDAKKVWLIWSSLSGYIG